MEKNKLESLLIDYIDNKLNSVDRHVVEQELVNNAEAYKLYEELKEVMHVMDRSARLEPSSRLQSSFEQMLKEEMTTSKQTKTIFFQPGMYRAAAAVAVLAIAGAIGLYIKKQNDILDITRAHVLLLEKQTNEMMAMLNNDQSASQRIKGVNVALSFEKADDKIVEALVTTMNQDPNSNVRLAALDALSKFVHEKKVREELVKALAQQKDPIVQIKLIQLLVQMKEKGVVKDLQKMVDDEGTMHAVKDEAYSAIMKLS